MPGNATFVLSDISIIQWWEDDPNSDGHEGPWKRRTDLAPGTGYFVVGAHDRALEFVCPCGCGRVGRIPVTIDAQNRPPKTWVWNGQQVKPTLQPSVFNVGWDCQWHGYLTDGEWKSV